MVLLVEKHDDSGASFCCSPVQGQLPESANNSRINPDLPTTDPIEALDLFTSAIAVRDIPLARRCAEVINNKLNRDNVMFILDHVSKHKKSSPEGQENFTPSAPPLVEDHIDEDCLEHFIDNLRNNCLQMIDKHADHVLKSQNVLDVSYRDLLSITTRDTLQVSSEMVVYTAVVKWAYEECRRRGDRTPELKLRKILGELVYAPRYGLMSKNEFLKKTVDGVKGPDGSGVLTGREVQKILEYIKGRSRNQKETELPFKGSLPRTTGAHHSVTGKDSNCSVSSGCDKHIINFLTCWTAVFD